MKRGGEGRGIGQVQRNRETEKEGGLMRFRVRPGLKALAGYHEWGRAISVSENFVL